MQNRYLVFVMFLLVSITTKGQYQINLSALESLPLTPQNILSYSIVSGAGNNRTVLLKGVVKYKNTGAQISYTANYTLQPGMNVLNTQLLHPIWQYSSSSLKELFTQFNTIPSGVYEYCVSVCDANGSSGENGQPCTEECIYNKTDDLFNIQLIDPEDKAKINTFYPQLTWIANSSLSSQLNYRLRVAALKKGQNGLNAILRNTSMYDQKQLYANTLMYPATARPLQTKQSYVWMVDAYYKDLLLGSSEVWQFEIEEDTVYAGTPVSRSHIDIRREEGKTIQYAQGELKIKYILDKTRKDILSIDVATSEGKVLKQIKLEAKYGDNRYVLDLKQELSLKHKEKYQLNIVNERGEHFTVPFVYLNPDF